MCCETFDREICAGPLLDRGKLEGALEAPFAGFANVEFHTTLVEKAATLLDALVRAHAYRDGNKRLAWLMCVTFLEINGLIVEADQDEAAELVLSLTCGRLSIQEAALWLVNHSRLVIRRV